MEFIENILREIQKLPLKSQTVTKYHGCGDIQNMGQGQEGRRQGDKEPKGDSAAGRFINTPHRAPRTDPDI